MENKQVSIIYTNYKEKTNQRSIIPKKIIFSSNEWHKEQQWFLIAYDIEKKADRTFAMKNIINFNSNFQEMYYV